MKSDRRLCNLLQRPSDVLTRACEHEQKEAPRSRRRMCPGFLKRGGGGFHGSQLRPTAKAGDIPLYDKSHSCACLRVSSVCVCVLRIPIPAH